MITNPLILTNLQADRDSLRDQIMAHDATANKPLSPTQTAAQHLADTFEIVNSKIKLRPPVNSGSDLIQHATAYEYRESVMPVAVWKPSAVVDFKTPDWRAENSRQLTHWIYEKACEFANAGHNQYSGNFRRAVETTMAFFFETKDDLDQITDIDRVGDPCRCSHSYSPAYSGKLHLYGIDCISTPGGPVTL